MAFGLRANLEKVLNASQDMAGDRINPENLSSIKFDDGFTIPKDFMVFDQESADAEIDKVTAQAESVVQGTRVIKAYQHLADKATEYDKQLSLLQEKLAKREITRAEAFAKFETLKHQLKLAKRQAGLDHAAQVEDANVAFANFQRRTNDKLSRKTDTSRGGTEQGSVLSRRNRFPVAV